MSCSKKNLAENVIIFCCQVINLLQRNVRASINIVNPPFGDFPDKKKKKRSMWHLHNNNIIIIHVITHCTGHTMYLSESGPFLTMINLSLARPPRGIRSEPVTNARSCFFCVSLNSRTIFQKLLKWEEEEEGGRGEIQQFSFYGYDCSSYWTWQSLATLGHKSLSEILYPNQPCIYNSVLLLAYHVSLQLSEHYYNNVLNRVCGPPSLN